MVTVNPDTQLDIVAKAVGGRVGTSPLKHLWEESFERNPTIQAARALAASKVIAGIAGSWIEFTDAGFGTEDTNGAMTPPTGQTKINKIGQPGRPEINFAPYSWRTNRFGPKGPSLLGHPISFSVVGPTLKSPFCDWQWEVVDNTGAPLSGDLLRIDDGSALTNDLTAPSATTLQDAYGFNALSDYPYGLYVVISQTGEPGVLAHPGAPDDVGGLSDGCLNTSGGRAPLVAKTPHSKYEVFRVIAVEGTNTLRLDPVKRLSTYFTIPGSPAVRGITLVTPYVTRLQAIPGSGPHGREQTFVTLSPDRAAGSDLRPPWNKWSNGGFDPRDPTSMGGIMDCYREDASLPVPLPISEGTGRVGAVSDGDPLGDEADGAWDLVLPSGVAADPDNVGRVFRVYKAEDDGAFQIGEGSGLTSGVYLGWFECLATGTTQGTACDFYSLRRVTEVDPTTGTPFFGTLATQRLDDTTYPGARIHVWFTVHEPISTLYSEGLRPYNADAVAASRLAPLIDPSWVERSTKAAAGTPPVGSRAERGDRAIFDTAPGNDPGNLLDLGFRMVLFPALPGDSGVYPDFDHPITTPNVVLDPTVNEPQSIEIDYAAGVVRLSHPPRPGAGCAVDPYNTTASGSNPRREIILFAACVPYSMEPGQLGAAVRVTGDSTERDPYIVQSGAPLAGEQRVPWDVYDTPFVVPVQAQVITSGAAGGHYIDLDWFDEGHFLPQTGFFELLRSAPEGQQADPIFADAAGQRQSTFGYSGKVKVSVGPHNFTRLTGVYGGGVNGASFTADSLNPVVAVFRSDVVAPTRYNAPVEFQQDLTYGQAKRSETLHFKECFVTPQVDGSTMIEPAAGLYLQAHNAFMYRDWVVSGAVPYGLEGEDPLFIQGGVFFIGGRLVSMPETALDITGLVDGGHYYVFLNTSDRDHPRYDFATSLPLSQGILIGDFLAYVGLGPSNLRDLRNPLTKIDERFDILVGGAQGQYNPHFATLAEAVDYASEIMSPTAGFPGFAVRIKVVGKTVETRQSIIKTNGLIIEGAQRRAGASDPCIEWGGDFPLIDIHGSADVVAENLCFRHTAPGGTDALPPRAVFTNTGADAPGVSILGCRATGANLHGLLYLSGSVAGTCGLPGAILRDNYVEAAAFGVYIHGDPLNVEGMVVADNQFIGHHSGALVTVLPNWPAGVHIVTTPSAAGILRGVTIQGNRLEDWGWTSGLLLNTCDLYLGDYIHLLDNVVQDSAFLVQAGDHCHIVGNVMATDYEFSVGLWDFGDDCLLEGNHFAVATGGLLWGPVQVGARCRIVGNELDELQLTGIDTVVSGNRIHKSIRAAGANSFTGIVITGNRINRISDETLLAYSVSFVTPAVGVIVSGNWCDGMIGLPEGSTDCLVADNELGTEHGTIFVGGTGHGITGNVTYGIGILDAASNLRITGNTVTGLGISRVPADSVVDGNYIVGDVLLQEAPTPATGCTITGNKITGGLRPDSGDPDPEKTLVVGNVIGTHLFDAVAVGKTWTGLPDRYGFNRKP